MWKWVQSTGELSRNGEFISKGYSGKGRGKNNPKLQNIAGVGPIPTGKWHIMYKYDSKNVGPYTLTLYKEDGCLDDYDKETHRSAFRIHGDSIRNPDNASKGCIILPRKIREKIWQSGDRILLVEA